MEGGLDALADMIQGEFARLNTKVDAINGRVRSNELDVQALKGKHERASRWLDRMITASLSIGVTIVAGAGLFLFTSLFN